MRDDGGLMRARAALTNKARAIIQTFHFQNMRDLEDITLVHIPEISSPWSPGQAQTAPSETKQAQHDTPSITVREQTQSGKPT